MRLIVPSAALVLAALLLAGPAHAQGVDHAARGYQLFADGELDEALRELELAYAQSPEPNLLFALGRVHAARKDCTRALDHFRRYLATEPGPKAADAARAEIDKCEPPSPDGPAGGVTEPVALQPMPPPVPERRGARRSFAGVMIRDRFVQAGLATGVAAGVVYLIAWQKACWGDVCTGSHAQFLEDRDTAATLGTTAGVLGGVAGALIVTGAVRHALRDDDDDARFEAAIAPARGGGVAVVSGRF